MMRFVRFATALAAIALAACGGFDVTGPARPAAPTSLTAALEDPWCGSGCSPDVLEVTWTPAPTRYQSYVLELSVDGGPWQPVQSSTLPNAAATARTALPNEALDGAVVKARVYFVENEIPSAYSPEAEVQVPLAAAQFVTVSGSPPFVVSWSPGSARATGVRVDRRPEPANAAPGEWATIFTGPPSTTHCSDADVAAWHDGLVYAYRVIYRKDTLESVPVEGRSTAGPLFTPSLTAVGSGAGVHVEVSYPGAAPVSFQVLRQNALQGAVSIVCEVAAGEHSCDDPAPGAGLWVYTARAVLPGWSGAVSQDSAAAEVLIRDAALEALLPLRVLHMPGANDVARSPSGAFALVQASHAALVEDGGAWQSYAIGGFLDGDPVAFDDGGRSHFLLDAADGPLRPGHLWYEAGDWHTDGPAITGSISPMIGALSAAGDPQFVVRALSTGVPSTVAWWARSDGAYAAEALPAPWSAASDFRSLAVDPDGAPGVLMWDGAAWSLVRRTAGVWSGSPLPAPAGGALSAFRLHLPSSASAVVQGWRWTPAGYECWLMERDAEGWSGPTQVPIQGDLPYGHWSAVAPDGSRLAIVSGNHLAVRAQGAWSTFTLLPSALQAAVGFTPAGKLWVLQGLSTNNQYADSAAYLLYEEP
jgi:hypothetical protein